MVVITVPMDFCWTCPSCRGDGRQHNGPRSAESSQEQRHLVNHNNNTWLRSPGSGSLKDHEGVDDAVEEHCEDLTGRNGFVTLDCVACGRLKSSPRAAMCLRCTSSTASCGHLPTTKEDHKLFQQQQQHPLVVDPRTCLSTDSATRDFNGHHHYHNHENSCSPVTRSISYPYLSPLNSHQPLECLCSPSCTSDDLNLTSDNLPCATVPFSLSPHSLPCSPRLHLSPGGPFSQIYPVETDDEEVQGLYVDAFLHNNRLEHMVQVMSYHPEYLECFLKTQQYMLRSDGPLPYDYRHYIAIMAAARHQCSYLIHIQTTEFLLQGGDERWLKGLQHIPKKLRDLYEFNKIMAHRPWLITRAHIEKLTRGNDNWSIAELTHAVVLLAHFHSLASFVYGCGINAEIDQADGHTFRPPSLSSSGSEAQAIPGMGKRSPRGSPHSPGGSLGSHSCTPNSASGTEMEGGIEVLMEKMRRLTEEAAAEEVTQEELLKRFERVETLSAELPAASKQAFSPKEDILRYVEDPDFTYQDFAKRGTPTELPTFRAQDYSWEDQGYSLANRLYPDIGTYLDDKFNTAYNLTYYTMGDNTDVDTTSFRRSIWNYIHCMFGIRHDDYDYCEVNQLLERNLKAYVKTVTCFPERVTRRDYDSFMREFKHSEKVHVNLMLLEARMQAELLYALRAITRYMT